jgi:hypothetical protein
VGYASKLGRARINSRNPQAAAICDRCGFVYNHVDLQWQHDWAGATTVNKRLLVCSGCLDTPQQQLRAIVIPADPMPIINPRPQEYRATESNTRQASGYDTVDGKTGIPIPGGPARTTQADDTRVTQQTGAPNGALNQQPGTDPNAPGNDDPGLPYDNVDVPNTGPLK